MDDTAALAQVCRLLEETNGLLARNNELMIELGQMIENYLIERNS